MNSSFGQVSVGDVDLIVVRSWWESGVVHGMTTRPLSFVAGESDEAVSLLCGAVGATALAAPKQCHGNEAIDLRASAVLERALAQSGGSMCRFREGDALLAPTVSQQAVAFGVMSADCVPVIVRGEDGWALIHAGWRGLANGVIREAVGKLRAPVEAAVFPCAGGDAYEVGQEVVSAIGTTAVCREQTGRDGRFLLDAAATAVNQLRAISPTLKVASSGLCTITDTRFHSYRRDGERAGRAVTFLLPAQGNP